MHAEPSQGTPRATAPTDRAGKILVVAIAILAAVVSAYFALGMPGMDHSSGSPMDDTDMSETSTPHRLVDAAGFEAALDDPGSVVVNVHVPYDGEIAGTDLFIPFDEIGTSSLPSDHSTELLVYCRSGTMSAVASATLVELGYTNIIELDGGMQAWQATGRELTTTAESER